MYIRTIMLMYKESTLISNKDSNIQKLRVFSNRYTINCCHKEALALLQRDDKGHRRYTFAELMMRFLVKIVGYMWIYIYIYVHIIYIVVGDLEQVHTHEPIGSMYGISIYLHLRYKLTQCR